MTFDIRKDKSVKQDSGIFDDDFFTEDEGTQFSDWSMSSKDMITIAVKLLIVAIGTLALMYYEKQNLDKLKAQKVAAQSELNKVTEQKKNLETEIKNFTDLDSKSQEFMAKLEIIQNLAKKRLLAISGLDHIQSVIPETVWLNRVSFRRKEFSIDGTALTNKEVQNFVEALENTGAFEQVNIGKFSGDRSSKEDKNSQRRQFTIVSTLKE